jgi:hypothetical protein
MTAAMHGLCQGMLGELFLRAEAFGEIGERYEMAHSIVPLVCCSAQMLPVGPRRQLAVILIRQWRPLNHHRC